MHGFQHRGSLRSVAKGCCVCQEWNQLPDLKELMKLQLMWVVLLLMIGGCHTSNDVTEAYYEGFDDAQDQCQSEEAISNLDDALSAIDRVESEIAALEGGVSSTDLMVVQMTLSTATSNIESAKNDAESCQ